MNDLGRRLDALASSATRDARLTDPSSGAPAPRSINHRRRLLVAVLAAVSLAGLFLWWQGNDSKSTSVVAAEGEEAQVVIDGGCVIQPVLEILTAGVATFDYEPAGSYVALADNAQVVVSGRIVSAARSSTGGRDFIELVLADVTDVRGEPRPDVEVIAYDAAWADASQSDPLHDAVSLDGVSFVGFLSPWSGVRAGWTPGPEGLYVACGENGTVEPVLGNAAGPRDPTSMTLIELRAWVSAHVLQIEREAAAVAAEEARIAAQQAAARDRGVVITDVADARALWDAAAVGDYRFRYAALATMGSRSLVDVLVEDGEPTLVDVGRPGAQDTPIWSVDDLFEMIESADEVREAAFDPILGYPTQFSIDPDKAMIDEELSVVVAELFSAADIETAAADLEAWLPQPDEVPAALVELMVRFNVDRTDSATIGDAYLLQADASVEVYLYRSLGDLCLLTVGKAPQSENNKYGSMGTSCQSDTQFGLDGDWGASSNDMGEPSHLVVVPPARYIDESWHIEVTATRGYRIEMTERSALVVFDGQGDQEDVVVTVRCTCGDLTYGFELLANE